jgi:hypothetical protein
MPGEKKAEPAGPPVGVKAGVSKPAPAAYVPHEALPPPKGKRPPAKPVATAKAPRAAVASLAADSPDGPSLTLQFRDLAELLQYLSSYPTGGAPGATAESLARLETAVSALSDKIAKLTEATDKALARVQVDVDKLNATIAELKVKVEEGTATPEDIAALEAVEAKLNALDPTVDAVLPPPDEPPPVVEPE